MPMADLRHQLAEKRIAASAIEHKRAVDLAIGADDEIHHNLGTVGNRGHPGVPRGQRLRRFCGLALHGYIRLLQGLEFQEVHPPAIQRGESGVEDNRGIHVGCCRHAYRGQQEYKQCNSSHVWRGLTSESELKLAACHPGQSTRPISTEGRCVKDYFSITCSGQLEGPEQASASPCSKGASRPP